MAGRSTVTKFRMGCVFIEPETVDVYSLILVDIAKNTMTNEILKISIGKQNRRKKLPLKEIKRLLPKTHSTHVISSIQGLSKDSIYFPLLFNTKTSNELVTSYMSNFSKIEIGKGTPQNIQIGEGLYLHQTEGGASGYVIDMSQIEVETIAIMASLQTAIKNKTKALLEALEVE